MTYQKILWAIERAAELAARSTLDAFRGRPAAEFPTPEMAWEVVNELYESGDAERPFALPEFFTRQFAMDYGKHLRSLAA